MSSKIGPRLQSLLDQQPHDALVDVSISLDPQPGDLFDTFPDATRLPMPDRETALNRIIDAVTIIQAPLINSLDGIAQGTVRSIWVNNVVGATVPLSYIYTLDKRNDVRYMEVNAKAPLFRVLDHAKKIKKKKRQPPIKKRKPAPAPLAVPVTTIPDIPAVPREAVKQTPIYPSLSEIYDSDNLQVIGVKALHDAGINLTGNGVIIAVVDTGINHDHLHLKDQMWDDGTTDHGHGIDTTTILETNTDPNGVVTIVYGKDTMDENGHGTACAGLVAGKYTGVARQSTVMAIKVLSATDDDDPTEQDEQRIWEGIKFAARHCHIISMSVSFKHSDNPNYVAWRDLSNTLHRAGIMHVNSSGKLGMFAGILDSNGKPYAVDVPNNIPAPANCPPPWLSSKQSHLTGTDSRPGNVIACGCCNNDKDLVDYSGHGPAHWDETTFLDYPFSKEHDSGLIKPDLVAPGVQVPTCELSGGTRYQFSGTSAATPQIAGAVALLMEACLTKGLTTMPLDHILEALSQTSSTLSGRTTAGVLENTYGPGCINVYDAYNYGREEGRDWW